MPSPTDSLPPTQPNAADPATDRADPAGATAEPITGDSVRSIESLDEHKAILRAIAHTPPRSPTSVVVPGTTTFAGRRDGA